MEDERILISGFGSDIDNKNLFTVDFAKAKRLDRSGSTCDAYECVLQRRRVFVKRLKSEYRNNPLYRAAFDKEYDIGVSLSHPSLPHYASCGDGYIVMDFIEGDTLADLIKQHDSRLKDKKFVKKLLSELIDVVEYLHNRNIVHCDIKSDNIIISPYKDRPVKLVDLDKAYTAWLEDTSGNPAKYDCDSCADGRIDFHGIGKIADQLGQKRVASVCRTDTATADTIRKILNRQWPYMKKVWRWWIAAVVAVAYFIVFRTIVISHDTEGEQVHRPSQSADTIAKVQAPASQISNTANTQPTNNSPTENTKKGKASGEESMSEVDEIVKLHYGKLYRRLEYLRSMAADPNVSATQLQYIITSYANDQHKAQNQILLKVKELYGLGDPFETIVILNKSKEWSRFMKQDFEINKLYCREIEKRGLPADSVSR